MARQMDARGWGACISSVRNSGQHSDIVRPYGHFVQPNKVWVRHLAKHYLNAHLICT